MDQAFVKLDLTNEDILNKGLSLEDAKAYINAIDFSMITKKMVEHQGWLQEEAEN